MVKNMNDIEQIFGHIKEGNNFLLSGGAGSGKTFTLVEVLKRIFAEKPSVKVACITYTNIATNEIKERVPFNNLHVSTIHSFLWDSISHYQQNLKESFIELLKDGKIKNKENIELSITDIKKIQYTQWRNFPKGEISHDEVIILTEYMFSKK